MMLLAYARNDVMFAITCPQAHIIAEGNIICEAYIICPKGKHHSKTHDLFYKSRVFVAPVSGFEPLAYRLGGGRSIHLSYTGAFFPPVFPATIIL